MRVAAGRVRRPLLLTLAALLMSACAADMDPEAVDEQSGETPQPEAAATPSLALGARGPEVEAVQDYLRRYGYFPNAELAGLHQTWHPIVATAPERGVFDEATRAAVLELQRRSGLDATGTVDEVVKDLMQQPRCGVPDTLDFDEDSKFALHNFRWTKRSLTWKVRTPTTAFIGTASQPPRQPGETDTQLRARARNLLRDASNLGFTMWMLDTDLTFREVSEGSTADITVSFGEVDNGGNQAALAINTFRTSERTMVSSAIVFDWDESLSFASPTPAGHWDAYNIAVHEIGHALTLDHSSSPSGTLPVMNAHVNNGLRTLAADDRTAISARYDLWNTRPGLAEDMAVGANGDLWHIGTAPVGDGFRIYKWQFGGGWIEASGNGGATRIAVAPNGTPWIATRTGAVFYHSANHAEGGWNHVPNLCAKDLSFGADSSLWFVTCTPDNDGAGGGFKVGKLIVVPLTAGSATFGIQEGVGATHAQRISVAPNGTVWIVGASNDVFFRNSTDPNVAGWGARLGVKASDISISVDYFAYVTGAGANAGRVYVRNDQPSATNTSSRAEWVQLAQPAGGASVIAAGHRTVWITNGSKAILENTAKNLF